MKKSKLKGHEGKDFGQVAINKKVRADRRERKLKKRREKRLSLMIGGHERYKHAKKSGRGIK